MVIVLFTVAVIVVILIFTGLLMGSIVDVLIFLKDIFLGICRIFDLIAKFFKRKER